MTLTCLEIIQDYGLRSIGLGERVLPKTDITICHQATLIGSGMLWNIYFGVLALILGFFFAILLSLGRRSDHQIVSYLCDTFILIFRGTPLFIQFFFAYFLFLSLKKAFPVFDPFTSAWLGALIILFFNTSAYSANIFYGALVAIPRGEIDAADSFGMSNWQKFRSIEFRQMLRLAWPAYINEAIFMFHATTLVFFSAFPTRQQKGDALYYANYFADKTFNPFIPFPIVAIYFIVLTIFVVLLARVFNSSLSRHLPKSVSKPLRLRFNFLR